MSAKSNPPDPELRTVLQYAGKQVFRIAALEKELRECMDIMSSLRDFVAEGGSRSMVGAGEAIGDADRAYERAHALLKEGTNES